MAKDALIHPVKFGDLCAIPQPPEEDAIANAVNGIDWIVSVFNQHPAHMGRGVVNLSGGNDSDFVGSPMLQQAVRGLLDAGLPLVQAAGNQQGPIPNPPGNACVYSFGGVPSLDEVIVVGGTDLNLGGPPPHDGRWRVEGPGTTGTPGCGTFCPINDPICDPQQENHCDPTSYCSCGLKYGSTIGTCIDLWAPAAHIVSASSDGPNLVYRLSGTSMAAPHVAGAVALYLESYVPADPCQVQPTPAEIQDAIVNGATCGVLDQNPGSTYYIGNGSPDRFLDVHLRAVGCPPLPPAPADDHLWGPTNQGLSFQVADLLANDVHPIPGGTVSFNDFESEAQHGYITYFWWNGEDTIYNYIPDFKFNGVDSFDYSVVDQNGLTAEATAYLAIEHRILANDFESGDTSAWTSPVIAGGATLSVTASAALDSAFGLAAGLAGTGSLAYVEDVSLRQACGGRIFVELPLGSGGDLRPHRAGQAGRSGGPGMGSGRAVS